MAGKTFNFSPAAPSAFTPAAVGVLATKPLELPFNEQPHPVPMTYGNPFAPNEIYGINLSEKIVGGLHDDFLHGLFGHDTLWGGEGDDRLWGDEGHDELFGGDGDDTLYAGEGADTLVGGAGDDWLYTDNGAAGGRDLLIGGTGNDTFNIAHPWQGARHTAFGGEGDDDFTITGEASAWGEEGNDTFFVLSDASLFGGEGNDTLRAEDPLWSVPVKQILSGGTGADHFQVRVSKHIETDYTVLITDFGPGDTFDITGAGGFDTNNDGVLSAADAKVSVAYGNLIIADNGWQIVLFNVTEVAETPLL